MKEQWTNYRDLASSAAVAAAAVARRYQRQRPPAEEKAGYWDLVTEADREAQVAALQVLRAGAPEIPIVAEEGADAAPESGLWWLVDPIDGTTNFVHGLPYFCSSVALIADGAPVAAAVADPSHRLTYAAARGAGAHCNRRRLHVDAAADFPQALLSSRVTPRSPYGDNMRAYSRVSGVARATRNLGSAELELCHVACGWLSAFWEMILNPWDYAAGALLVAEAGGIVTDAAGLPLDARRPSAVVASNGRLHAALLAIIQREAR